MAKATPMTEDELRALTDSEMRQAVGYYGGKLAAQRQKAEYYYLGLAKGDLSPPEIEGRSSVVSPDVRNTIESMLPQLMLKFCGGDSVVEFEPTAEGDEEKANTITEYLNYLYFKKNAGHKITYQWFKDALLQKVGIVKVWLDTRTEETKETYKGLDDVELSQLLDDDEIEPIEHNQYPDEDDAENRQEALQQLAQQLMPAMQAAQHGDQQAQAAVMQLQQQMQAIQSQPPKMLHDVTFKRRKAGGKIALEGVPPEEFLISRRAKDIATASFCAHRAARTVSDLTSMGYKDVDQITSDDSAATLNMERVERLSWDDESAYLNTEHTSMDDSQRIIWVTECYIRCDFDGTGISELRKVTRAGNVILDNEVVDVAPFVSICPVPMPHKFFGLSIADLVMEGMKIKTSLLRTHLDNQYLSANGRTYAVENQVNLDDLLTSRPGGVVRIKQQGAVGMLDQGRGDAAGTMASIEYMEDFIENASGWTRYSQGNDQQALNKTLGGMNIVTNRADMRLDLIARNFAEGFTDLFRMMLKLVCQHQDKETITRIGGKWMNIDPREWKNQFDVSINIGLGSGNKDQQAGHMMNILALQEKMFPLGVANAENIYNAAAEMTKLAGFKSVDKFFSDPAKAQPQPPKPDPEMMKLQAQQQNDAHKFQAMQVAEQHKQEMQAQQNAHQQELEARRELQKQQLQAELDARKHDADAQKEAQRLAFERWKAELESATRIAIAEISAKSAIDNSLLSAMTTANQEVSEELTSDDGTL